MTEAQAGETTRLMYILCDVDRIGYLCKEITESVIEPSGVGTKLSKEATKDLKKSVKLIHDMYEYALDIFASGNATHIKHIQKKKDEVLLLDDKMRQAHIDRVGKKKCSAKLTALYNSILHDIDRMGNSCVNLVDMAISGDGLGLLLENEEIARDTRMIPFLLSKCESDKVLTRFLLLRWTRGTGLLAHLYGIA